MPPFITPEEEESNHKKEQHQKTADDYPQLAGRFKFDKISTNLRSRPFDTEDLYDKVINCLKSCEVPQEAWEVDCDEASRYFHGTSYEELQSLNSNDSIGDKFSRFKLPQVTKTLDESTTVEQLKQGLIDAYVIAYANVFMPEKIVRHAPPIIAHTLELYVFTFGLTDFLQRVREERDRMRHSRSLTILRDLGELQLSGAACKDSNDMTIYIKRVKPAFKYVETYYQGTPLGDSFNASVVGKALEAIEKRVPQLQMPYKLSNAYDRCVIGGEVISADEAIQMLTDISQFMVQNEELFREEFYT